MTNENTKALFWLKSTSSNCLLQVQFYAIARWAVDDDSLPTPLQTVFVMKTFLCCASDCCLGSWWSFKAQCNLFFASTATETLDIYTTKLDYNKNSSTCAALNELSIERENFQPSFREAFAKAEGKNVRNILKARLCKNIYLATSSHSFV